MTQWLTPIRANAIAMLILSLVLVFHVLVLSGVVPYAIVWGGRVDSDEQMQTAEAVSIFMLIFILWILAMKSRRLPPIVSEKNLNGCIWAIAILFALNTLGNLLSENRFEKIVFTPITLLLTVLCLRMVITKRE